MAQEKKVEIHLTLFQANYLRRVIMERMNEVTNPPELISLGLILASINTIIRNCFGCVGLDPISISNSKETNIYG